MSQCRAQFSENKQNNSTPPSPISIIIFPLIRIFTLPIILKKIFDCEKKKRNQFLSMLFSFLIFKNNESDKKNFPPPPPSWLYSGRYFAFFQISRNAKKIIKTKILPHNSIVLLLLLWNDMVYICLTVAFFSFLFANCIL